VAIDAFQLMIKHNVSGVAVVGQTGHLINHMSIRDLKLIGAEADMFWRLYDSVLDFTQFIDGEDSRKNKRTRNVAYVTPDATIASALHMLVQNRFHRVYIVDNDNNRQPIGVCSLSDLIKLIIVR